MRDGDFVGDSPGESSVTVQPSQSEDLTGSSEGFPLGAASHPASGRPPGEHANTRLLREEGRSDRATDASGRAGFHSRPGRLLGWREGVAGLLSRRCLFP